MPIIRKQSNLQRILVTNAKGGCGKSTLATNLAAYFAHHGSPTALLDYDPQGSSLQWIKLRGKREPSIYGVDAHKKPNSGMTRAFQLRIPDNTRHVILDTPAGMRVNEIMALLHNTDALVIPVLPSPIDIHAATHFIRDLLVIGKVRSYKVKIGVVANRVRHNTVMYQALRRFLKSLNITFITSIRDTQNYSKAAQQGVGIHELQGSGIEKDLVQWGPLIDWISRDNAPLTGQVKSPAYQNADNPSF